MGHMVENKTENTELICIKCNSKLFDDNVIDKYPDIFSVYLCPQCGNENDRWILFGFGKRPNLESIIRAQFLDSYLHNQEMNYNQIIQSIKEKYSNENFEDNDIIAALNTVYVKYIKKRGIKGNRYPKDSERLVDEKFYKIIISKNNRFEDFFNGKPRIIRQWDLKHLNFDLDELKIIMRNNGKVRYENRWNAAINYFQNTP